MKRYEEKRMSELTHLDKNGNAIMVDVTDKAVTERTACASGIIHLSSKALDAVLNGDVPKGDVFAVSRVAGIMAVKKTPELIPLCHSLLITNAGIDFEINKENSAILCSCTVKLSGKTGAEMEALTGVSTALLTIYDMCKALDHEMEITNIHLDEKSGGKSGNYVRRKNQEK